MLPPQIDGSTLRTLCLQHGPLITFHLNLTQGNAVVRYSSKEEAAKAQKSLHMYVSSQLPKELQVPMSVGRGGGILELPSHTTPSWAPQLLFHGSGCWKSKSKVWADWIPLRPLFSACREPSSLCSHVAVPCASVS
jgi:hypothetical protein